MTNYQRGYRFEVRVRKHLEAQGWRVFRSAGSRGPADLLALRLGEVMLIQCKANNGYLTPAERQKLVALANELGVIPVIVGKRGRKLELSIL